MKWYMHLLLWVAVLTLVLGGFYAACKNMSDRSAALESTISELRTTNALLGTELQSASEQVDLLQGSLGEAKRENTELGELLEGSRRELKSLRARLTGSLEISGELKQTNTDVGVAIDECLEIVRGLKESLLSN